MTGSLILLGVLLGISFVLKDLARSGRRKKRKEYYNNVYLKSNEWTKKRALVLKRDSGHCKFCGRPASQVHHLKYALRNIGREPIDWLVSICPECH